ncbi:polysaccharide deacetylase family protein [Anaerocolumna sp. MB42-C2]|uniref:polysaccharide deacetylase family protein n=1 Tax=Anaerocolumna sp. MB42-C2 TaxID=3070997 RepID=UPI0027DF470C|nr:polysaccharide deacetylase family protein [Anaerocolumna sp. MB42-C2]WMJ88034.1 polysaccharide deacetylase family protein [Anaerocolumna sp. MB42-C2]
MDKAKQNCNSSSNTPRNNRVKRIKLCIIIIALVLLILPTILCIVLFFRLNYIQKQLDILMIDKYGVTYSSKNCTSNETVTYSATTYKSSGGAGLTKKKPTEDKISVYDKLPSLEENSRSEYNNNGQNNSRNKNGKMDQKKSMDQNKSRNKNNSKYAAVGVIGGTAVSTKKTGNTANKDKTSDTKVRSDGAKASVKDTAKKSDFDKYKDFDKKTVYITFDDGPSKYTDDILKILTDYNVKATFFVIGKADEHSKKMYKEILKEGHSLGMHSYSHDYNKIYKSAEDFDKDFTKIRDLLYDTTGYFSSIYRFPGGSSSSVMKEDVSVFIKYLNQKSVVYFDWNVVSGDATGMDYTPKQLYNNVINGIKLHNRSIVLMHDTDMKENSVKSLKMILKTLTEQRVKILPLNENVTPIQQVKLNSNLSKK